MSVYVSSAHISLRFCVTLIFRTLSPGRHDRQHSSSYTACCICVQPVLMYQAALLLRHQCRTHLGVYALLLRWALQAILP